MEKVVREMVARRVVKNHLDTIAQKVFGFLIDELTELDLIDELCKLSDVEETLLTEDDKLWAGNEVERRRLEVESGTQR